MKPYVVLLFVAAMLLPIGNSHADNHESVVVDNESPLPAVVNNCDAPQPIIEPFPYPSPCPPVCRTIYRKVIKYVPVRVCYPVTPICPRVYPPPYYRSSQGPTPAYTPEPPLDSSASSRRVFIDRKVERVKHFRLATK